MSRFAASLGVVCLASMALADDVPANRETLDLRATQVTLAIDHGGRHRLFQATALEIDGDVLTVVTAASRVDGEVEGHGAQLLVDGDLFDGTVVSVVCNPTHVPGRPRPAGRVSNSQPTITHLSPSNINSSNPTRRMSPHPSYFSPIPRQQVAVSSAGEIPGADNAIVRLRFPVPAGSRPNDPATMPFRKIRPVPGLASSPYPPPSGAGVTAWMVGGDGRQRGVMAGNFHNPLLLEWGHGFDPISDDSGAGVFVLHETADGRFEPVLIGVVIGPDERGGRASLFARKMSWVEAALTPSPKPKPQPATANPGQNDGR